MRRKSRAAGLQMTCLEKERRRKRETERCRHKYEGLFSSLEVLIHTSLHTPICPSLAYLKKYTSVPQSTFELFSGA